MKKIAIFASLITSGILCLLLGSQMLFHGDFFYLSDQARDFILTRDIVLFHKFTLIGTHSGIGGLFHGPLWLYLLSPVFFIGRGNPMVFAYFYMLIPLFTIVAGYIVGKKLYGNFFGVLVAFLLGTNPILWGYINNTIGINLMPLLYIAFLYCSILYIRGNQKAFIFLTFFVGLSFQFETASAIALIPISMYVFLLGWSKKVNIKIIALSIISFFASLVTFILFDVRHHFLIFTSTLTLFNQHQGHQDYANLMARVLDHLMAMKNSYTSFLFSPIPILIFLSICVFVYFCYYVYVIKLQQASLKEYLFFFLTPAIVYIFYLLYPHPIYGEYVLDLVVSLVFAFVFMLIAIWRRDLGKVLLITFVLFTAITIAQYFQTTYPYKANITAGSFNNQKAVTDWIWSDAKDKPFGYFVYTPETFTYGMDYLFWWESSQIHKDMPQSKKLATTYLILYPTLANDTNGHEFWKLHTLHTQAKVEKSKEFQGDIVVEKLDMSTDTQAVDLNYYQNLIFR